MPRLKDKYYKEIVPLFIEEGFKNKMAVPKLVKVVVNVGIGRIRGNDKLVEYIKNNLTLITGQKPYIRKAKKAISGFKVREGDEVGLTVTLRGNKAYDFLDKLANVDLPRLRDFRGLDPKSFGKSGNFTLGVKEHIIFAEISHESENLHGMEITIVTTATNSKDAQRLLESFGLPFKKEGKEA